MVKKISVFITILGLFFLGIPQFNSKAQNFVIGDNVSVITPDYDMSNDVWLDGNMISDVYYRYDIIYDNFSYAFLQDIEFGYLDGDFSSTHIFYIDLDPMYNFIFAKLEDQGNGLYYWTEVGYLNPEEPTFIKTIIIDKYGINFKGSNYNSSWHKYLWDDFENDKTSLIGYENNIAIDYYNYNNGYDEGYWDGRNYGFDAGFTSGRNQFGYWDWVNDVWRTAEEHGDISYDNGYRGGKMEGYYDGLAETDATGFTSLLGAVFGGLGALLSIEILPGIYIGAIIAVPLVFGIIFFILGKRKGD